jgi:hypothetical protein
VYPPRKKITLFFSARGFSSAHPACEASSIAAMRGIPIKPARVIEKFLEVLFIVISPPQI